VLVAVSVGGTSVLVGVSVGGTAVLVGVSVGMGAMIASVAVTPAVAPTASVTTTGTLNVPACVGFPSIVPSLCRVKPGGRSPVAPKLYGGWPPVAVSAAL